jgi:S-adenosylhomocysteine hydrolase
VIISKIVDEYLSKHRDESAALHDLIVFCKDAKTDAALTDRRNFTQHITSSAILVSRKTRRMLKIYHKDLKEYFQPGGHIPEGSNLLQNARGVLAQHDISQVFFVPDNHHELIPLDIDTHTIPANGRGEPEHVHHDFRYLFVCDEEFNYSHAPGTWIWTDIPELIKENTFMNLVDKVQFLWSNEFSEKQFYQSIVEKIAITKPVTFIAVQHFLPGVEHFFRSLTTIGKIGLAIPKPKSLIEEIGDRLSSFYPIYNLNRENVGTDEKIKEVIEQNDNVIIFDIGGWFAGSISVLCRTYPDKIIGVIEDTENGHQKYEKLDPLPCPLISVARSPLKLNEDTLIGLSIVFSADSILRQQNKLLKYLSCGILGYGKVGKSIADDLMAKSIKPIVYETNPLRLVQANNDGCLIGNRNDLLANCDAIFCATGQKSICTTDLSKLKRGAYIFSVTSADDEFDFSAINSTYKEENIGKYVTRYYSFENSFFLVNRGNAVNFIHNAVVGDFIHLVKGEMLMALNSLLSGPDKLTSEIKELDNSDREQIARIWLRSFHNLNI